MSEKKVAYIIVCWNNQKLLDECINSIKKQTYKHKKIVLVDFNNETAPVLDALKYNYTKAQNLKDAFNKKADVYIVSGINSVDGFDTLQAKLISDKVNSGAKISLLKTGEKAKDIFPGYITAYLKKSMETAHMDITESQVFQDMEYFDLRYFSNDKPEKPIVYGGLYQVNESKSNIQCIASGCEHRYRRSEDRRAEMLTMKGFPIVAIENGDKALLSEMMTDKGLFDPIAAKLLANLILETIQ